MAKLPSKIGKYEVEDLIATGGMGAVYKAIHPTLNRNVIIKKLTLKNDEGLIQRFNREARIMMDFTHDNIVNVYDHFKERDSYYIVLEYVDGITLGDFIKKEGRLSNELALYIILEISKALKYAHDKGVVHRDIKPANILISKDGEVKLVDFGIAASEDGIDEDLTTVGMTMGTPSYMAPEQFGNSKNVDKTADIYSLGVMLYEMMTGEKPFPSGMSPSCIALIQKGKYQKAKKINFGVSRITTSLIKNLMHHKSKKRYQDLDKTISILHKYFKKEKLELYKNRVASTVSGNFMEELPVKKNKRFLIPVLLIIILPFLIYSFLERGYQYELISSSSYGAFNINLKVNKDYYKDIDEIFIKSKLFVENGTELQLIDMSNYEFSVIEDTQDSFHLYQTKKIYLPVGFYRLKLMVDGNLFWKNFHILSRKDQKSKSETENGQIITLEHRESDPLPFHPVFTVSDQITLEDLTESSTVLIQVNGKFRRFISNDNNLKTGQVHYFQFSQKGYYPKDYILKISHDQTDLKLDAGLFPKPGIINIKGNYPNIKIKINNSSSYILGDRSEKIVKINKIGEDVSKLILSPGEYFISFSYWGNRVEENLTLTSDDIINIDVNYNKDNKSISVNRNN